MRNVWNQIGHGVLLLFLLCGGLYCVLRINEIQAFRFFGAGFDSALVIQGLTVASVSEQSGALSGGNRIVAVDGKPVADRSEFRHALAREQHVPVRLTLLQPEGTTRDLIFWDAPRVPAFRVDASGGVTGVASLPAAIADALEGGKLASVAGADADSAGLTSAYSAHPWWLQFSLTDAVTGEPIELMFWESDYRHPWTLLLLGICFGGLGLTVYQMRAGTRSSRAFLWFCFASALFFMLRSIPGYFRTGPERQMFGLILCGLFVASVHFAGTFTSLRAFYARSPLYFRLALTATAALLFAWFTLHVSVFLALWSAALLGLMICVLMAPGWIASRGIHLTAPDLQRNRIASTAIALAFAPGLFHLLLNVATEKGVVTFISEADLPGRFWFEVPIISFPLLIGYAVIRRNLLQVNELLVEGATYGLLAVGMSGAFATFVGLGVPIVESIRPGSSVLVTAVGAGLVAWFGYPVFSASRQRLADRFHQSLRGYDVLASRLAEWGERSDDRAGFCEAFAPSLRELTRAATVTLVLPRQFAPAPICAGELPEPVSAEESNRCWRRILDAAIEDPRELQREDLIDSVAAEQKTWELLDALDALRLLFVFPLVCEGQVLGLVGLSGKADNRNYSRAELRKLRFVARECALALYGFTVRENMRAKRRAEENLRRSEEKLRDSQKLEAVATLAGGIAHDFHNLITAIFAFTSVAKETLPFDHPAAGAISNVEEAARQASGITKSLLVFTRKSRSERAPLDLGQFLPRAVRFIQSALPSSVRLDCDVQVQADLWVEADESQLHQVVMNLVLNARDAMPDGGDIRIRVARIPGQEAETPDGTDRVILEVADSGTGMTDEVRRRAFEPFFTTKNRDKGTGLGLSIVRGIVRDNGGGIDLESAPGQGTRVEISFPACRAESRKPVEIEKSSRLRPAGQRILVADDNRMIRLGLATCLGQEGYEVVQAGDGEVFAEIIRTSGPTIDLVVLDFDMPGLKGLEGLQLLAREGLQVPVILITGEPLAHVDPLVYSDVTLLKKPFGIPGFMSAINERLAHRPADSIKGVRLIV